MRAKISMIPWTSTAASVGLERRSGPLGNGNVGLQVLAPCVAVPGRAPGLKLAASTEENDAKSLVH